MNRFYSIELLFHFFNVIYINCQTMFSYYLNFKSFYIASTTSVYQRHGM